MKDSLKWFLSKFPFFLNKNEGSNFYKSSYVINDSFKDFNQDLFNTHLSHRLDKRVLVWKEQEEDNDYTMNFYVHLPYLKMVNVYKNDSLIYSESYEYADEVNTFVYSHDDTSLNVIPEDKFHVTVETWEEFVLAKGFPENDTTQGDMYDHDPSLDDFGALYDIPRKKYVYTETTNPGNTEPPYNNKVTEDDYHYMNRILGYISHMQDTPLPVLEIWKLFGIPLDKINLVNRERYLCKMYSAEKHGGDNWVPKPWEHKDTMSCFWPEAVFFFVEVDNHSPVYGQSINFSFTFLNMFGEDKGNDYSIDVYLDDTLIATGVNPSDKYSFSTVDVDDTYPLTFKFVANPNDTRYEVLESDEVIITIKGCNSADWYVATDGNDNNIGDINHPFRTLDKALSMVEGSQNVIVLKQGTFWIDHIQTIDTHTSIISCQGAVIRDDNHYDFFNVLQDCSLYLMGITLKHKCCEMHGTDHTFINNNVTQNPIYLRINPEIMCKPPVTVRIDDVMTEIYAHTSFTVQGTLLDSTDDSPVSDEEIQLISEDTVVDTDITDENGEYDFIHQVDTIGTHYFQLNHEESQHYCMGDSIFDVTVNAMPTTLTGTMDTEVLLDDELIIAYDLVDYYGSDITVGTVKLYDGDTVVASVTPGQEFHYTPTTVGTHNYKLTWEHDDTYVPAETPVTSVVVRKYDTNLFLESSVASAVKPTDSVTFTGTLTDELGNKLSGQTVKLYDGETLIATKTTNAQGKVTHTSTYSLGKHVIQWKYETTRKYDAVNSNSFRLRVKTDTTNNLNLYLYPNKKIGVTGTTIGLNVLALDNHGDPVANTSFKLTNTFDDNCEDITGSAKTTGNDGWWSGNLSTNAITTCHGVYIQAVSTADEDVYSNVVHVFDTASPLLDTEGDVYSSASYFDKNTSTIPVSVGLYDEEEDPLPLESFSVKLIKNGSVVSTTNGTTTVTGEGTVNVSIPSSVRGNSITLRLVYSGRGNAYNSCSAEVTVPYMFSPVLTLTSSKASYYVNETVALTGVIKDEFNNLLSGKSLKVYEGTTVKGTQSSNASGQASFSLDNVGVGSHTYTLKYAGDSQYHDAVSTGLTVSVVKYPTATTLSAVSSTIYIGQTPSVSGTLKSGNTAISGASVKIYSGSTLVATKTTDSNGAFSYTGSATSATGTVKYKAVYEGNATYEDSQSSEITITVTKRPTVTTLAAASATISVGDTPSVSGTLKDSSNNAITGASVKIYKMSINAFVLIDTVTTGAGGAFSFTDSATSTEGTLTYKAVYDGDSTYAGSESSSVTITVMDLTSSTLTLNALSSTVYVGEKPFVFGSLENSSHEGIAGATISLYKNTGQYSTTFLTTLTTDSNGEFTYEDSETASTGNITYRAVFEGDATYTGDEDSVTVTVTKIPTSITLSEGSSSIYVGDTPSLSGTLKDSSNNGITSVSVKIYQGNTLLGTVTTGAGGAFSYTGSATTASGSLTYHAVYEGTSSYASVTSSDVTITVSKIATSLNIDVPLSLVYSDAFNITGTLTDSNNNGINNATVKLKVGNTVVDTGTTNSSGIVQFTQTPVSMGNHTFQLVFETTNKYLAVDSQTVTRDINKETSVITVTSPIPYSSWYSDGSITITGVLTDNDGEVIAGKSIKVYEAGESLLATLTTGSNGAFSGSISGLSVGDHKLVITFNADTYYTASTYPIWVTVISPTLSVTGTKSVLSYHDHETSTITATYTGGVLSGRSVVFKNGSTTLDTVTTDSNGQASYTYTSTGAGDVTITVECMNLQEIYEVEDCWNISLSEQSITNSNTGVKVSSIGLDTVHNVQNDNFAMEFDLKASGVLAIGSANDWNATQLKANYRATLGMYANKSYTAIRTTSSNETQGGSLTTNEFHHFKLTREGSTVKFYVDDTLITTKTASFFTDYSSWSIYWLSWDRTVSTFKNIRLKAL